MGGTEQNQQEAAALRENSETREDDGESGATATTVRVACFLNSPVLEGGAKQEPQTPGPHLRAEHMGDSAQPAVT